MDQNDTIRELQQSLEAKDREIRKLQNALMDIIWALGKIKTPHYVGCSVKVAKKLLYEQGFVEILPKKKGIKS